MTETSHSSLKESISALVDGEANELELQRVLKSMDKDDETRDTWARYHLMSSVANKSGENIDLTMDLSGAISDAIAEEPVSAPVALNRWWTNVGKTAVAAMVTFGVVFGVQQYTTPTDVPGGQQLADNEASAVNTSNNNAATGAVVPQGFDLPPLRARTVSTNTFANSKNDLPRSSVRPRAQGAIVVTNEEFQQEINRLMFKHAEQVSTSGGLGVIPFARVSELGEEEQE